MKSGLLLQMLLVALGARGLAPEAMDPWRAWVTFKHYARVVDEVPDPGVSVQLARLPDESQAKLFFLRQMVAVHEERLEPVGGVVCEFTFDAPTSRGSDWALWSFDYPSFARFVDRVEQEPDFQDLIVSRPLRSSVHWESA
ncbi:MAG: hypothetical protein ACREON_02990 [Gemmatimonadaceae bacterium]